MAARSPQPSPPPDTISAAPSARCTTCRFRRSRSRASSACSERPSSRTNRARVIIEKPFGHDLESARHLNAVLHSAFAEEQIFRIDHFLGKEDVQNILAARFANGFFEPIWNRGHIDNVQIDVPETLGLEHRAGFYESTGAYRDMIVTHLLQAMGFVAMERPQDLTPDRALPAQDRDVRGDRAAQPAGRRPRAVRGLPVRGRRRAELRH